MNNQIKDMRFFSAGRALFTVGNGKGEHYTFKIRQPKGENKPFFVSILVGQNNENDYAYLGIFNPKTNAVVLTAKSKYNEGTKPVMVVRWAIQIIAAGRELPEGYTIQHEGKCCHCGRTLTVPESIEKGIGPECEKYWN